MSPFAADATTESSPPPEEQNTHEPPMSGGFRFKGRVRSILLVAVVALVVGALALISVKARKNHSSGSSPQSTSALADTTRFMRLRGTTEAAQTRAILAPLLAGQQVGTLS